MNYPSHAVFFNISQLWQNSFKDPAESLSVCLSVSLFACLSLLSVLSPLLLIALQSQSQTWIKKEGVAMISVITTLLTAPYLAPSFLICLFVSVCVSLAPLSISRCLYLSTCNFVCLSICLFLCVSCLCHLLLPPPSSPFPCLFPLLLSLSSTSLKSTLLIV